MTRRQLQHFTPDIGWQICCVTTAGAKLLLADLFLKFSIVFLICNFRGVPCFAKQQSGLLRIDPPERVRNASERSSTQCLIVKLAGVGCERHEQPARAHATLPGLELLFSHGRRFRWRRSFSYLCLRGIYENEEAQSQTNLLHS